MSIPFSRREMIARSAACVGAAATVGAATPRVSAAPEPPPADSAEPFGYCLNTATIRGLKLPIDEEIEVAAKAGYQGFEPWIDGILRYVEGGGSLPDLRKRLADRGLSVEGAIGFPSWVVDDDKQRAQGVEQIKRDMDLIARLGGKRLAAPPAGGHRNPVTDLRVIAERYRVVLEAGREAGVVPELEIWGTSPTLSRPSQATFVAMETAHPDACLLLDAYHMYKGGFDFTGLRLLNWAAMQGFHINDYPADPPREEINDSHRVYPGDGVCPLPSLLRTMHGAGYRGMLSLELFNRDYWQKDDALTIARTGLEKTRAVVRKTFS